ncbi:hypothetical protein [Niveibacterium sp. COAC-50]|uniref:hypothetical protein n=1 Tax=Niveibacterium sp. COAC-50 TaxID=2729384 RepID=UPI001555BBAE|nr:hypothetical protein [Niveibacterium sp. COAC-50]
MLDYFLPALISLVCLFAVTGLARHFTKSAALRSTLSVVLVILGLLISFFFFFGLGTLRRGHQQPAPTHGSIEAPALHSPVRLS